MLPSHMQNGDVVYLSHNARSVNRVGIVFDNIGKTGILSFIIVLILSTLYLKFLNSIQRFLTNIKHPTSVIIMLSIQDR